MLRDVPAVGGAGFLLHDLEDLLAGVSAVLWLPIDADHLQHIGLFTRWPPSARAQHADRISYISNRLKHKGQEVNIRVMLLLKVKV